MNEGAAWEISNLWTSKAGFQIIDADHFISFRFIEKKPKFLVMRSNDEFARRMVTTPHSAFSFVNCMFHKTFQNYFSFEKFGKK